MSKKKQAGSPRGKKLYLLSLDPGAGPDRNLSRAPLSTGHGEREHATPRRAPLPPRRERLRRSAHRVHLITFFVARCLSLFVASVGAPPRAQRRGGRRRHPRRRHHHGNREFARHRARETRVPRCERKKNLVQAKRASEREKTSTTSSSSTSPSTSTSTPLRIAT